MLNEASPLRVPPTSSLGSPAFDFHPLRPGCAMCSGPRVQVAQRQNIVELARSKQKENDLTSENTSLKAELKQARSDLAANTEEMSKQAARITDLENQISKLQSLRSAA